MSYATPDDYRRAQQQRETRFFYVHRYAAEGWHVTRGGDWNTPALCGEPPHRVTGFWTTRRRFNEQRDPRLDVDGASVCGVCLLLLPAVAAEAAS